MIVRMRDRLQQTLSVLRLFLLRRVWGMDIGEGVRISGKAFLDYTHPQGIHIGSKTIVTPGARVFAHDFVKNEMVHTWIGSHCFIGANAMLMPGVRVGDHCIVAAGSVVTTDVPSNSMVAGNPARVLRSDIRTKHYGMLLPHETEDDG